MSALKDITRPMDGLNHLVRTKGLWNHKRDRFIALRTGQPITKGRFFETIAGPNRINVWGEVLITLNEMIKHEKLD